MQHSWFSQTMFLGATDICDAAASSSRVKNCLTTTNGLPDALPNKAKLDSCKEGYQGSSSVLPPSLLFSLLLHGIDEIGPQLQNKIVILNALQGSRLQSLI